MIGVGFDEFGHVERDGAVRSGAGASWRVVADGALDE